MRARQTLSGSAAIAAFVAAGIAGAAVSVHAAPPSAPTVIVLGAFGGGGDGASGGSLTESADGVLYGTTDSGGIQNLGTVFAIAPDGTRSIVHVFRGGDGAQPTSVQSAG